MVVGGARAPVDGDQWLRGDAGELSADADHQGALRARRSRPEPRFQSPGPGSRRAARGRKEDQRRQSGAQYTSSHGGFLSQQEAGSWRGARGRSLTPIAC